MRRTAVGLIAMLAVAALLVAARVWTASLAEVAGPPIIAQQQRAWQSRWAAYPHDSDATAAPPPPSAREAGQSSEARHAVATALTQLVPPKGDGRRGGYDDQRNVQRESDTVRRMLRQDGLAEWRPDAALLPRQLPAGASMAELLHAVPINGTAWLAFGNAGATEMLTNWISHVLRLGLGSRFVIAAYDNELLTYLRALQVPAYNYSGALPTMHFRGTPFLFHRMGFLKALTIREVLLTGRHVLVSDSDVVWLRDPTAELLALAAGGANLAPSTDCINVEADRDKTSRPHSPYLCGHAPGNLDGAVFNTGVIFLASTAAAIAFCARWADHTLHLPAAQWWSDDQGVFNQLLTGRGSWPYVDTGFYPIRSAGLDGRLIHAPEGLVIAPLPAERFCSGHLVWMQQDAHPRGCASVHATFTEFGDAGKRWRLLEAGLWSALPPRYYSDANMRFLTFEPPVPPVDPAPCAATEGHYKVGGPPPRACGGEDPKHALRRPKQYGDVLAEEGATRSARLRGNIELMRRQLHALRDAAAIAYVLNRTLVLPHFDCLCDRSELVDYIPFCVFPGAPPRLTFPRKCSTHFVLNIHKLLYLNEPASHGVPHVRGRPTVPLRLRAHAFLSDTRAKATLGESIAHVEVRGQPAPLERSPRCSAPPGRTCLPALANEAARATSLAATESGVGGELVLRRGADDREVQRVLGSGAMRQTRLLKLSDAEGAFHGWADHTAQGEMFNALEAFFMLGGDWCCTSRRANDGRLYPVDPPKLRTR